MMTFRSNSKADYNVLCGTEGSSEAQYREDTWHWDDNAENRLAMFESATGRPAHNVIVGLYRILGRSGMLAYLRAYPETAKLNRMWLQAS